jgi:hypothetical protein
MWTLMGISLLAAVLSCCGSIDGPEHPGDPLWTLHGKILEAEPGVETGELRVAFVWERHFLEGGVALIAQDIPINPEFPSEFTLDLFEAPPEEAMHQGEDLEEELAGLRVAGGILLVYDDRNTNQELDVLPKDAQAYIDYVLGPAERYMAMFIEGDPQGLEFDGVSLKPGLNLFLFEDRVVTKLPVDAELVITLVDDPEFQSFMCEESIRGEGIGQNLGEVHFSEIPEGADISCADDKKSLTFEKTTRQQDGVCGDVKTVSVWGQSSIDPVEPAPEGWPC